MKEKITLEIGEEESQIFDVHIMLLEDEEFISIVIELICKGNNSDYALNIVKEEYVSMFTFRLN